MVYQILNLYQDNHMKEIRMNHKQMKIYRLACEVLAGKHSIKQFSMLIGKSYRQAQRIVKRVKEEDFLGVYHGNFGKWPWNKTPEKLERQIVDLLQYKYFGFNLTHFREMIEKNERIKVKKDTIHRIAKKYDLVKHPHRRHRRSFQLRTRMPREGMMVQFDGSNHDWFGNVRTDLLAAIDDATGKILNAEFFMGETSLHSMKVIKEIIEEYGIPESFYMDQAGLYGKKDRDWESQISRAFSQVNIQLILAGSPQAKGRVERLFRTLQDRLVAEFKLHNIETMEEANKYLKDTFIPEFNSKFSHIPRDEKRAYRKNVFGDLDRIFCRKIKRNIGTSNEFSWENVVWKLKTKLNYRSRNININLHIDGDYSFDIMGKKVQAKVHMQKRRYDYNKRAV